MLPRSFDGSGARRNDHVPGRGTGSATHGCQHIEPVILSEDFGSFRTKTFDIPVFRISPGVVDVFHIPNGRKAVV